MTARDLAAQNMDYARICSDRFTRGFPSHVDRDEYEGIAQLALVEAASRFDETRGSAFTSYAWARMWGAMLDAQRRHFGRKQPNPTVVSLDEEVGESLTRGDTLCSGEDVAERVAVRLDVTGALRALTGRERRILLLRAAGVEGQRIADQEGVTESRVSQLGTTARSRMAARMAV